MNTMLLAMTALCAMCAPAASPPAAGSYWPFDHRTEHDMALLGERVVVSAVYAATFPRFDAAVAGEIAWTFDVPTSGLWNLELRLPDTAELSAQWLLPPERRAKHEDEYLVQSRAAQANGVVTVTIADLEGHTMALASGVFISDHGGMEGIPLGEPSAWIRCVRDAIYCWKPELTGVRLETGKQYTLRIKVETQADVAGAIVLPVMTTQREKFF